MIMQAERKRPDNSKIIGTGMLLLLFVTELIKQPPPPPEPPEGEGAGGSGSGSGFGAVPFVANPLFGITSSGPPASPKKAV